MMDELMNKQLRYLGLHDLAQNWDAIMKQAAKSRPSYHRFLTQILKSEYQAKARAERKPLIMPR